MERQGCKHREAVRVNDKQLITAAFCGSPVGDFLPPQIIYKGKTPRCHPRYQFPPDWHITQSEKHWSNEKTMFDYVSKVVIPYVESIREHSEEDTPGLAIMDNFKGQVVSSVTDLLEANNIHTCLLPPKTTDKL